MVEGFFMEWCVDVFVFCQDGVFCVIENLPVVKVASAGVWHIVADCYVSHLVAWL